MIKNSSSQNGSAFAVMIVLLVVSLVGTLCFVLWQWSQHTEKQVDQSAVFVDQPAPPEEKRDDVRMYSNETYSFNYPNEGWTLEEPSEETGKNPSIKSDNLISEPFRVITGAAIYINQFPFIEGQEFEQRMQNSGFPTSVFTNIKKTTVDDLEADSYTLNYEGIYHITEFINGGTTYQIRFQVADGEKAQYNDVYELFVDSFKFK